ncbi:hypothetical protein PRK78_003661 [Emydomyces testavorans]|uniref:Protein Zds1 C-terminal domain-containing protein n=1 Tax=Emydomyces testavorans TaxID=2070801 RepID=A0AAF0DH90_9EURO|nr:hypothetical protein PRK78_003661 [Emydomyces testavorans]
MHCFRSKNMIGMLTDLLFRQRTRRGSYDGENGRNTPRRGTHVPQLSISDESHHVTEAIGHMYDDDYDRRSSKRLSFVATQQDETISTSPIMRDNAGSPNSVNRLQHLPIRTSSIDRDKTNGRLREQSAHREGSGQRNNGELSPGLSRAAATETSTTTFKVNDLDYESGPEAVAQELSNLAALRRMSMDIGALDPDLPSLGSNFNMPSIAPSSSADEDDTSRLFWVPARLHPGIAPKEFKSFLESKADQIKRRSGELSFLDRGSGGQAGPSGGGGLRRKKSMLSRHVEASSIVGGSDSIKEAPASSLEALAEEASSRTLSNHFVDDKPILPPAPPGHSLRRSTRTTYRKGSLKNGERLPRRFPRQSDSTSGVAPRRSPPPVDEPPILGLTRVSTDPTPVPDSIMSYSRHESRTKGSASDHSDANRELRQERPGMGMRTTSTTQVHGSSTPRSVLKNSPTAQRGTQRADSLATEENRTSPVNLQQHFIPERKSSHEPPPSLPPQMPLPPEPAGNRQKKLGLKQGKDKDTPPTLNEIAAHPPALPGGSTRTDCLSVIPTITEDKKPDKKSKEKKDSESGRKSSWHWRRSTEDKDKDKKKDDEGKRHKSKSSKSGDKMHDNTRLDVLQTSIDGGARARESLVLDRSEVKLSDDDRRKDKKSESGEAKKEKESSIFSSIFGSKKNRGHDSHKKHSRYLSPEPRLPELKPDVDYNWTRFSLLQERAIYRMAHIKLANPRRALYSQVLLSNFMYSYLAKVQQMHPHMSLPTSPAQNQQRKKDQQQQQEQEQEQPQEQSEEYTQYQGYQQSLEQDHSGDSPLK